MFCSGDDSFESEMQKALDNIKIGSSSINSSITALTSSKSETQSPQALTTKIPSQTIDDKSAFNINSSNDNQMSCENSLDSSLDKSKPNVGRIRSKDCDEVRVMQKVLANEVSINYIIFVFNFV